MKQHNMFHYEKAYAQMLIDQLPYDFADLRKVDVQQEKIIITFMVDGDIKLCVLHRQEIPNFLTGGHT